MKKNYLSPEFFVLSLTTESVLTESLVNDYRTDFEPEWTIIGGEGIA